MFSYKLHPDEQLLELYRKHEITLLPKVFEVFVLLFVPWYLGLKYDFIFSTSWHAQVFLIWNLILAVFAAHFFLVWNYNVYIISSKRLIHIAHKSIFKKNVNETPLDRILNVSFRTTGLFSTIFGYGDVLVQVVGLDQPLILEKVPNPSEVKDFLWQKHLEYGGEQKITYTQPEIAPTDKYIPYAPNIEPGKIVKSKRDV